MYKFKLFIGEEEVELFKDETITLNSTVQNTRNISKIFTDFSQTFSVPASQINNKLFSHWYNIDIVGGFDHRILVDSTIELNFLPFKQGQIRLNSVTMANNKPKNYKITFFGLLVSLSETFKGDYLVDLNISAYDHVYDYATVNTGLTTGLSSGNIIYPLMSSVKRWYYSSDTADDTNTDTEVNIAYEAATNKGIKWSELKPAIKVMPLIEAVESKYGLTFSRDFIGTAPFDDLYLWMSIEKGYLANPAKGNEDLINWTSETGITGFVDITTDRFEETTFWEIDGAESYEIWYTYDIQIVPTVGTVEYSIILRDEEQGGNIIASKNNVKGTQNLSGQITAGVLDQDVPFNVGFYISSNDAVTYTATVDIVEHEKTVPGSDVTTSDDYTAASSSITSTLVVSNFLPKIKVIDFFNGIMKMFNLAIVPNSKTDFFIDTLDEWYAAGVIYDISNYIDYGKDIPVSRTNILSDIKFSFTEPETFLAVTFEESNSTTYGNLELLLEDGSGNLLDGNTLDISLPFSQMIYERLTDDNTDALTDIQYAYVTDDKEEPVLPEPHLFYAINQSTVGATFGLLNDSATPTEISTAFMPFHGDSTTAPTYSTLWGSDLNEWDGVSINNSLYNRWYNDYISDIFSVKRRQYNFTAILPLNLITVINLNDILIIKDAPYIINNMNINFTTGETKLELLNFIGALTGTAVNYFFEYDLNIGL